jgi:RNA polymerase sigma-70 factor (ECF subfamily)
MYEAGELGALLGRAAAGDEAAATELFSRHRRRLKRMVRLRFNRRLLGRIDDSDILQEAYLQAARRLPDYLARGKVGVRSPFPGKS